MNFVFYDSFYETANELAKIDEKLELDYYRALVSYGICGEIREDINPIVKAMLSAEKVSIDTAHNRYTTAVENGKKGGRPRKMDYAEVARLHKEGYTNEEIAKRFDVKEDSVRKVLKQQAEWTEKQKNLTETLTVTDTDTKTDTETVTNNNSVNRLDF